MEVGHGGCCMGRDAAGAPCNNPPTPMAMRLGHWAFLPSAPHYPPIWHTDACCTHLRTPCGYVGHPVPLPDVFAEAGEGGEGCSQEHELSWTVPCRLPGRCPCGPPPQDEEQGQKNIARHAEATQP